MYLLSGPQMKEKKKGLATLKEQLKALKMDTAVSTRYLSKDLTAGNEHERRLQRTQVSGAAAGPHIRKLMQYESRWTWGSLCRLVDGST